MKREMILVVFGLLVSGCTVNLADADKPLVQLKDARERQFQVVEGLTAENLHSVKGSYCDADAGKKQCWDDFEAVFRVKGKASRSDVYWDYEKGSRHKVRRIVHYYDSPKQTEVFVYEEIGSTWRLRDDYITSTLKFTAALDRFEF